MTQDNVGGVELPDGLARALAARARADDVDVDPFANPMPVVSAVRLQGPEGSTPEIVRLPPVAEPSEPDPLPCGHCGQPTQVLAARPSDAMVRAARCPGCLRAGRTPGKPDSSAPTRTPNLVFGDPRAWESEQERQWDEQARVNEAEERRKASWASWQDEIGEKWQDARIANVHAKRHTPEEDAHVDALKAFLGDRVERFAAKQAHRRAIEHWKAFGKALGEPEPDRRPDHTASGLLLSGQAGSGKTWAAYAYLNELILRGLVGRGQVRYGTEASLLTPILTASFSERNGLLAKLKDKHVRVLMIDDLGQGNSNLVESRHSLFQEIFDFCYENNRVLVLTTELLSTPPPGTSGPSPLEAYLGGRAAYSRMRSMVGRSGFFAFPDRDVRGFLLSNSERSTSTLPTVN